MNKVDALELLHYYGVRFMLLVLSGTCTIIGLALILYWLNT